MNGETRTATRTRTVTLTLTGRIATQDENEFANGIPMADMKGVVMDDSSESGGSELEHCPCPVTMHSRPCRGRDHHCELR